MEKAIRSCQLIQNLCPDNRHPIFEPLAVAVHTYYARPFKNSKGVGRLSDEMIPPEKIGIHHWLEHFRDSVLTHTDADHTDSANRPMHDVVYFVDSDGRGFSTSSPLPQVDAYRDAEKHCDAMSNIFLSKIKEFEQRFPNLMPFTEGNFLMTLDNSTELFTPHTLPGQGTLHYS